MTNAACVDDLRDGRMLLAVPVELENRALGAAVGVASSDAGELCVKLADTTCRNLTQSAYLAERDRDDQLFTEQFSANLDELAWLRTLPENLEFCNPQNQLQAVAGRTFPRLRGIIHAESLALVRRASPSANEVDGRRLEFPVWIGESTHDEAWCVELIDGIAAGAENGPFVWNFRNASDDHSGRALPQAIRSCILVRIETDAHHHGWILALNKVPPRGAEATSDADALGRGEFGTAEASLLLSAARMLATHASNLELFREQRALTINIIRSLVNVVDARDRYTCGHSDRVALMAQSLAGYLGFPDGAQQRLYLSGLLHDVGKIAIPDKILLKPGRLTPEEFAEIKKHPQRGVEILKHIRQFHNILPGVLHHHEAYDGSGYPHGLRGESIPLMGRLLAVVDAFDAMTTCRPYRDARSREQAVEILRDGAGGQWDPEIAATFLEHLDDIAATSENWESHISGILDPDAGLNDDLIGRINAAVVVAAHAGI
ncbi:MAG: HD-GYP domain-containing protein [Planctomycetaceae bacterium]